MKKCFGLLNRKLRSENGASLMMALLLFVVCAVIGSIVLTAGTISSGRLADKAEMDERYYKVFSAAEIIKEELSDKTVVVTRTKNGSTYSLSSGNDFLSKCTLDLLSSKENNETMYESDFYSDTKVSSIYHFNVAFNVANEDLSSEENEKYGVDVNVSVQYGIMTIDVSKENYVIRMTFAPIISETINTDGNVETKVANVTWALNNVEKVYK